MSYQAIWAFDDDRELEFGGDVAGNQGYARFLLWAGSLDPESFPELAHLAEYGECYPETALGRLREELSVVIDGKEGEPPADVVDTAAGLLKLLTGRPKDAAYLMISDGTSPADGG